MRDPRLCKAWLVLGALALAGLGVKIGPPTFQGPGLRQRVHAHAAPPAQTVPAPAPPSPARPEPARPQPGPAPSEPQPAEATAVAAPPPDPARPQPGPAPSEPRPVAAIAGAPASPAVCIEGFDKDWRCKLFTEQLCGRVQQHVRERQHLQDAFRVHGHVGDVVGVALRLRKAQARGQLSIAVIGNSVTDSCNSYRGTAWPERLAELLKQRGPSMKIKKVALLKMAPSGGTISSIMAFINKLRDPDLVIVDTSMGDQVGYRGNTIANLEKRAYLGIQALRSLKSKPAVMFSELMPGNVFFKQVWGTRLNPDPCKLDVRKFGHWDSLTASRVPAFSLVDFMCAVFPKNTSFRVESPKKKGALYPVYWHPEGSARGPQHPSCDTHEVIAHAFAQFVQQSLQERCVPTEGRDRGSQGAATPNPLVGCVRAPANHFSIERAPSLTSAVTEIKARSGSDYTATGGTFPALVQSGSWVLAEDKPGSPGWIALPDSTGQIVFRVKAKIGLVIIGYLKTYTDVGTATCRAGAGPELQVDARISERISVRDFFSLDTGRLPPSAEGKVNVTCRTDGRKFKITWLKSC